ncbi:MAG TPA: EF-hand domain-containing protein [Gemmataceae bacterium]|nr:EF-hand domain-containing protein [Gemmataceae bacterium]
MRLKLLTVSGLTVLLLGGLLLAQPKDKPATPKDRPATPKPATPSHVDEMFDDHDKNKDGFLTRDELPPGLRARFDRIDADKDGKLSRAEVDRGLLHLLPQRRSSDLIYAILEMSAHDAGCCGELQRAYDLLRRADKNKDGKLDADELKAAREQVVKDRIAFLIKELDADGDGRISKAEARGPVRANFTVIDTNKDGFINRDELLRAALDKKPAALKNK